MEKNKTIEQICYRILLTIGNSPDLDKMLSISLSSYMRELSCTRGAILLRQEKELSTFHLELAHSIPKMIDRHETFNQLYRELIHSDYSSDLIIRELDDGIYYVLSIGNLGMLVLYRKSEQLSSDLLEALKPVNHKLSMACSTCRLNEQFQTSSHRFMDMANMLPGIILELDLDLNISFYNRYTQEIFRQVDSSNFKPDTLFDFFPKEEEDLVNSLIRQLDSGIPAASSDLWMKNSRGERFKVDLTLSPIREGQRVTGYRGIAIDITRRNKLEQDLLRRDRALRGITLATQELIKSNDLVPTLEKVVQIVGSGTGIDRCYLFVNSHDQDGNAVSTSQAVEWCSPAVEPRLQNEELQNVPIQELGDFFLPLSERKSFCKIIREMEQTETKEILDSQNILSVLIIPIYIKEMFWGFIGFDDCTEERIWDDVDKGILDILAASISEAVEHLQQAEEIQGLYNNILEDLDIAESIQNYMLPSWSTLKHPLFSSSNYLPSTKIGGDLFDCIEITDSVFITYIADISGHGVQAALLMTAVKSIIQMLITNERGDPDLGEILTKLNNSLSKTLFHDNYMTVCMTMIDLEAQTLTCLNAGHPPLVILNRVQKSIRILDGKGSIPLGWIEDFEYDQELLETIPINPGDVFCLVTDGVYECTNRRGEFLGFEGFIELAGTELLEHDPVMIPHVCYDRIQDLGFDERTDDFTFVAFSQRPHLPNRPEYWLFLLESSLINIDEAVKSSEQYLKQVGASDTLIISIKLVLTEFLTNIIMHGNLVELVDTIMVEMRHHGEITLIFRDRAKKWELPVKAAAPESFFDNANNLRSVSGRGMQMIYSVTKSQQRVRYHRVNETRFVLNESLNS